MTVRAGDDPLVWLDLEMTGLDVEQHTIVEIACIVTDSDLTALDDGIDIVIHAGRRRALRNGRLRPQDAHEVGAAARDQRLRR